MRKTVEGDRLTYRTEDGRVIGWLEWDAPSGEWSATRYTEISRHDEHFEFAGDAQAWIKAAVQN